MIHPDFSTPRLAKTQRHTGGHRSMKCASGICDQAIVSKRRKATHCADSFPQSVHEKASRKGKQPPSLA